MGRIDKINQQVKREIGRIILRELGDPRLEFVTITRVDVSRDLRNAKIYFSVLGDESQALGAESGLNGAKGMIRKLLSQGVNMRNTPELLFIYDKSIEMGVRIEGTLKEIREEYEKHHPDNQEE